MFDPFQTQIDLFSTSFSPSQDSWPVFTQQNLPPPKSLENIFSYERPSTPPESFSSFNFEQDNDRPESMRTLYFGNLPPDLDVGEFLNYIRGGTLDEVKYLYSKNCIFVTFVDAAVAASCYLEYQKTPLTFEGYDCRVGWGKPSSMHPSIRQQLLKGASRNVFLGNVDADMTAEELYNEFQKYGAIDCIKVLPEKRIAFVHMCSIAAAVKAVTILSEDPTWMHRRIYYGRDRCCTQTVPTPAPVSFVPEENRTVYIGGIHPEATCKELCDVIRGGLLQQIKYFPEKNIAFATFIDAESATSFYTRSNNEGLVLKSKRMKIGWGKASQLPTAIANAVLKGASRNVYIGSLDPDATKESLHDEYSCFGEIELVNILPDKKIAFVSFTDIASSIKAVDAMQQEGKRVNFGKDRCANPARTKSFVSPPSSPHESQ